MARGQGPPPASVQQGMDALSPAAREEVNAAREHRASLEADPSQQSFRQGPSRAAISAADPALGTGLR